MRGVERYVQESETDKEKDPEGEFEVVGWAVVGARRTRGKRRDVGEQEERSGCGQRRRGGERRKPGGSGMKFEGQTFD